MQKGLSSFVAAWLVPLALAGAAYGAAEPRDKQPTERQIVAEKRFLHLPVRSGARAREVQLLADGRAVRLFSIEAGDTNADWWASFEIAAWQGQALTIVDRKAPAGSRFLERVTQGDTLNNVGENEVYREPLRPLIHVSPRRGFNNDPNGLVYFNGEYHLFFQYNPAGLSPGNQHWGHAVSRDLAHWEHLPIALHRDEMGSMYSGSAVVDWRNTSGFGTDGKPPLVLIYTATRPFSQCLAWSLDGRTFTKYERNPVVGLITHGNRDPKVVWHEPTKRWAMALYVRLTEAASDPKAEPVTKDTIRFLVSPDLKSWEVTGQVDGLFECPDLFPMPAEAGGGRDLWLLTAANSDYMLGRFDGRAFIPETPKLRSQRGNGFYAAQTFSDIPAEDGRRIMVGWLRTPTPGMPFTQALSVPLELRLLDTPEGPRLSYRPVKELERLRGAGTRVGPVDLKPGDADPLAGARGGEAMEVRVEFEPSPESQVVLTVRGVDVQYDAATQTLNVNGLSAPAPLRQGRQRLVVLADRTCFEVFASDGLCYMPFPVIPKAEATSAGLWVTQGSAQVANAEVHVLEPIWKR